MLVVPTVRLCIANAQLPCAKHGTARLQLLVGVPASVIVLHMLAFAAIVFVSVVAMACAGEAFALQGSEASGLWNA